MTQEILNLYGFHVHIDIVLRSAVVNSPAFKLALNIATEDRLIGVLYYLKRDLIYIEPTSGGVPVLSYPADRDLAARIDAIEQRIAHLQEVDAEVERLTA